MALKMTSLVAVSSNLFIIMVVVVVVVIGILSCINFTFLSSMGISTNVIGGGGGGEHQQSQQQLKYIGNKNISQSKILSDHVLLNKQSIGPFSPSKAFYTYHDNGDSKDKNNWITINHDIYGTRYSNQTVIEKDNVANLQVKWRLINDVEIQDSPIIIGDKGYVQDYAGNIIAFDNENGKILWKVHVGTGPTMGLTFNSGIVFASTGYNATVVAVNATDGKIVWQSPLLGNPKSGYNIPSVPIVWKDFVVVGSAAGGDVANGVGYVQGNITALNATDGKIKWNRQTTSGEWVKHGKAPPFNGDASAWSDGALDPETGIIYMPLGSPSPNFNASTRQHTPNLYANHMIAVNITNGNIVWATPFIDYGTALPVKVPDTHDWDTSWGSSISKVTFDNGTQKKIIIGHDKMGNIMAMDASTGKEIWWNTLGTQNNTDAIPSSNGSGMIWSYGIFNYHAVDNSDGTLYIAATNRGVNYFTDSNEGGGVAGHRIAAPHTIEQGLLNGTIAAMDLKTGKVKWQYKTEFPPRVSPLVTNNILFAGYIPFSENIKENTKHVTTTKYGVILALDKQTGKKLWEFDVHAPISPVGPSIGNGMLFVPTGKIQIGDFGKPKGSFPQGAVGQGSIVAFGLP
jgi:alcohol dehydrogenase (cytochrome c)